MQTCSHVLKKSSTKNFIFCAVKLLWNISLKIIAWSYLISDWPKPSRISGCNNFTGRLCTIISFSLYLSYIWINLMFVSLLFLYLCYICIYLMFVSFLFLYLSSICIYLMLPSILVDVKTWHIIIIWRFD